MFNNKVILICGYSRGGTNILWNCLQSHPKICSTRYEVGAIFQKKKYRKFRIFISIARKLGFLYTAFSRYIIDYQLYKYKLETFVRSDNKFKNEHDLYSRDEIKDAVLCLKSVDWDIDFTNLLLEVYPDMYIVMLTRNGYAVTNGHLRRGADLQQTSSLYKKIGDRMHSIQKKHPRTVFVKFEDLLKNPFEVTEKLYQFTEIEPFKVDKLRLKAKEIVNKGTEKSPKYGEQNRKYWFSRDNMDDFIDKGINEKQIDRLTPDQIREFNKLAANTLKDFGYDVLDPQTVNP